MECDQDRPAHRPEDATGWACDSIRCQARGALRTCAMMRGDRWQARMGISTRRKGGYDGDWQPSSDLLEATKAAG